MGSLISLNDICGKESWFFTDAYYDAYVTPSRYRYAWPSADYPIAITVHNDALTPPCKIKIRRWIETNTGNTVIFDEVDKSYRHYFDEKNCRYSNVSNRWTRFNFDNNVDALAFRLAFFDIIEPITDMHPTWHK